MPQLDATRRNTVRTYVKDYSLSLSLSKLLLLLLLLSCSSQGPCRLAPLQTMTKLSHTQQTVLAYTEIIPPDLTRACTPWFLMWQTAAPTIHPAAPAASCRTSTADFFGEGGYTHWQRHRVPCHPPHPPPCLASLRFPSAFPVAGVLRAYACGRAGDARASWGILVRHPLGRLELPTVADGRRVLFDTVQPTGWHKQAILGGGWTSLAWAYAVRARAG